MKKICYVTTLPITLQSFVLKPVLYGMKRSDWHVTFVSSEDTKITECFPSSITFIPIRIKRGISLTAITSIIQLYRLFKRNHYDLVQYATSNAGCYASIAAKMAGVPIRLYCQWGLGYVQLSGLRRVIFEVVERIICKCSTIIEPDSYSSLKIGIKERLYTKENAYVLGKGSSHGVDLNRFDIRKKDQWRKEIREKLNISDEVFVVGYVGRILGEKGINELVKAFNKIHSRHNNVCLCIVGSMEESEGLSKETIKEIIENPHIISCGYIKEIEKYYSAFDCTVLASYHEGFPNCVLESQAMGIPVIVTDIPGCIDAMLTGKTGLVVQKKSVKDIYLAIQQLIDDPEIRMLFGINGLEYVEHNFDEEYMCDLIFKDKQKLLNE